MNKLFEMVEGDVFIANFYEDKKYWKVQKSWLSNRPVYGICYSVIQCNKNGKTFKNSNQITLRPREEQYVSQHYFYVGNFKDVPKVSQKGLKEGARKRRIKHLKESIALMQKELERLENAASKEIH